MLQMGYLNHAEEKEGSDWMAEKIIQIWTLQGMLNDTPVETRSFQQLPTLM